MNITMIDVINAGAVIAPAKPCPFCGTEPGLATMRAGKYMVGCDADECEANPQVWKETLQQVWAAWNKRAQPKMSELEAAGSGRGLR